MEPAAAGTGRANQKLRTERAIVEAGRRLVAVRERLTLADVAREALVSEATVYRYFPDLGAILIEAMHGLWPGTTVALGSSATSADVIERVEAATAFYARHVLTYQSAIRAIIASSITRGGSVTPRADIRFELIGEALSPWSADAAVRARLEDALAAATSAAALFAAMDRWQLTPDQAVDTVVDTAATLTRAAMDDAATSP